LVLGVLTGCVAYQAAPLEPQHSAEQFAARRLDDSQFRDELMRLLPQGVTSWPPQQWDRAISAKVELPRVCIFAMAALQKRSVRRQTSYCSIPLGRLW
jgi:hypothetical protein